MMMKKLLVLIACAGLAFHTTGCTSNDSKPDSEVTSDFDSADLEKLEGDEALDIAGDNSLSSDSLAEDALGESHSEVTTTTETTTTTTENTAGMDQATTERTDVATNTETLPADPFAESSTTDTAISEPPPAPVASNESAFATSEPDSTTMVESTTSTMTQSSSSSFESSAPKANVPLQKAASTPWQVGKTWYNTVYFARPGDSLASVSQMIYGSDKTAELKKGNPSYKSRSLKPGDKVYYNSPHRSDDSSRLITYYEDNGIAPETYISQEGDNLRKVAKDVLGYDGAWKEVWSTNTVDSKGKLAAGTELRFWRGGAAATPAVPQAQELAGNHQQMDQSQLPPPPPPDMGAPGEMPPDMMQQAQNDFPPPPPMPEMAPPPPPPDMAMAPPPPPPPAEQPAQHMQEEPASSMDSDTTMALAVVGLAAAGLAVLIVMRKKRRQRELEQQAMSDTHVG